MTNYTVSNSSTPTHSFTNDNNTPKANLTKRAALIIYSFLLTLILSINPLSSFSQSFEDEINTSVGAHAPIGVMGDHTHITDELMISYRFRTMSMSGTRAGRDNLSIQEIISRPNTFAGLPSQPPLLRIVPTDMEMRMHMLGGMHAPSDSLTVMLMGSYINKTMNHLTFNPEGEEIGEFTTKSNGFGDTKLSALIKVLDTTYHSIHINSGISLPTGSISNRSSIITPLNTTPTVRLPYPMQLGSGTYDLIPGFTYLGNYKRLYWGSQYLANIRLDENSADYTLGDNHNYTKWISYDWNENINTSLRLNYSNQGRISGSDQNIIGPVQTADPTNTGGEKIHLGIGVNILDENNMRYAIEVLTPLYQDLNGLQLKDEIGMTLGIQKAF